MRTPFGTPGELLTGLRLLAAAGVLAPVRPDRAATFPVAYLRYRFTPATAYAIGARRHPHRLAVVDDRGTLTFAEIHRRTDRLARAFVDRGITDRGTTDRERLGLLCHNHRTPVEVLIAAAKVGADVVLLNPGLSAEQIAAAIEEQGVTTVVADDDLTDRLIHLPDGVTRIRGWTGAPRTATGDDSIEQLIAAAGRAPLPFRPRVGRTIVLTSGTTGPPKGAERPVPKGLGPVDAILSRIPLRAQQPALVSAPLFHTWGFGAFQLASLLGTTLVLRRRFDAEDALRQIAVHRCTQVFAVPVMLQRMLELPAEVRDRYDTSALRTVVATGSAMPGAKVTAFLDRFGAVLYMLYGSTEVSWASIATPDELRADPETAGRAPVGTVLRILDDQDRVVSPGTTGRIFVGNDMLVAGYTHGRGHIEGVDGLLGTGDLGHLDRRGLLFVTGRADDMIVSGGENVHADQVENLLAGLAGVREVAVVGVEDADLGQRLAAFVVLEPGAVLDAEDVRAYVRDNLARFAVPRDVVFLDELPRTSTGKVLKRTLRSMGEPVSAPDDAVRQ
jgi:acyl-CoA synthetase (AMP-forming)/AMP-acid ligase II